jgi:hypothetical protein
MATKRQIIAQGLEEIGLAEYEFDATPEELQSFLRRLDRIMAQWDGQTIRTGYNLAGGLDDESGLPDTVVNCAALHLGIAMAPSFGKTISPDTRVAAGTAYNTMLTQLHRMPQVPYPDRLPVGVGNKRGVMEPQYFGPNNGETPGLNDGATEY